VCARLTLTTTGNELTDLFGLAYDLGQPRQRRYNVAPSQPIPVVRVAGGKRELVNLRWGLIPHWAHAPKPGGYVNARAETVTQKPAFRDPFRSRRCLVPADGFYEWKQVGKRKQPYFFHKAGGGLWAYAGLWDRWNGPDGPVETVTVLTVPANELVRPLHDRMPAIVPEDRFAAWLDPKEHRPDRLLPLLTPYPAEQMECWPVSNRVNAPAVDEPGLTDPVPEPPEPKSVQPRLFDLG
jgi:putative SOS response-associated peptidase YedK